MTQRPFTPEQRAELAAMIEQAVAEAVQPIARQTTMWIQRERARLTDPRRTWTGAPVGATPPARTDPTPAEAPPPVSPEVHVFRDPPARF